MSVTNKVTLYFFIITFLLINVFVIHTVFSKVATFEIIEQKQIEVVKHVYEDFPKRIFAILDEHLQEAIADQALLKAFADRDRERFVKIGQLYYDHLVKTSGGTKTNFHIHLPNNTTFYRFHRPFFYDDNLKGLRPMLQEAVEGQKRMVGFEVGKSGLFQRVIQPVYYDGKYIGSYEVGLSIGYFAKRMMSVTDIKTSLRIFGEYADRLPVKLVLPKVNGSYEVYNNDKELFDILNVKENVNKYFTYNGRYYAVIKGFPLLDYSGKKMGEFIFVSDRTDLMHWIFNYVLYVACFFALFLFILYFIVKFKIAPMIGYVEQKYIDSNKALDKANQELEARVKSELEKNRKHEQFMYNQNKLSDMSRMINAIAHHWRQPLNALGLYVQDVSETVRAGGADEAYIDSFEKDSMDIINSLSSKIDDFRYFFRTDGEQSSEFDVIYEIISMLKLMGAQLENEMISLSVSCKCSYKTFDCKDILTNPDCEYHKTKVSGLKSEFRQVMLNIMSNSVDAISLSRAKGTLTSGEIRVDVDGGLESVRINITDNGGGISQDVLEKIFDPYFSTKDEGKGAGLGLYMSKVIVDDHFKGDISASNTTDGTRITLILPAAKATEGI